MLFFLSERKIFCYAYHIMKKIFRQHGMPIFGNGYVGKTERNSFGFFVYASSCLPRNPAAV